MRLPMPGRLAALAGTLRGLFRARSFGERGERIAERWLKRRGYKIVARRCRGQLGEIDLVAVDGRTVVFVEVKTRQSCDAGHPVEAVGVEKQRRLTRLAVAYLRRHDLLECACRFDVIAVTWPSGRGRAVVEHFPRAFEAIGYDGLFS